MLSLNGQWESSVSLLHPVTVSFLISSEYVSQYRPIRLYDRPSNYGEALLLLLLPDLLSPFLLFVAPTWRFVTIFMSW